MKVALKSFNSYKELTDILSLNIFFEDLFNNNKKERILLNRLYAKFVSKNDIPEIINVLENAKISSKNKTLMKDIIEACKNGLEYIDLSLKTFGKIDDSMRLVILDEPFCTISDNIPLEDYDNNDGEPFWMRPKYILEHYSKSNKK